jgi:hypothetical protein
MNQRQLLIAAAILTTSCGGTTVQDAADAAKAKAEIMTDTKAAVCKQLAAIPAGFDPLVDAAKSLCPGAASVQEVFAVLAGEACSAE